VTTTPTPTPLVHTRIEHRIATITLDRPDKRNALTDDMLDQLIGALDTVEADSGVRVVLLRGNGSSFCSGVDLGEKLARRGADGSVEFARLVEAFERLDAHSNPTIAILQGHFTRGRLGACPPL
jgi:enoyl-CoA hydratase/carnithine racemase